MEELKTLGTEYPYREEDFATPEHMDSILNQMAVPCERLVVMFTGKFLEFGASDMVEMIMQCIERHTDYKREDKEAILIVKHICSAPNAEEAIHRLGYVLRFGARYLVNPKYLAVKVQSLTELEPSDKSYRYFTKKED